MNVVQGSVRRLAWLLMRLLPAPVLLELRRRRYLSVLKRRSFAEPELSVVAALVRPGDRCLDVGANFGLYTVALSRMVGPGGHVISIEPMPQTHGLLTRNLRQLGITNVEAIQCALSDHDGEVTMTIPQWSFGPPNFYAARVMDNDQGFRIPSRRLDSVVAGDASDVTFIKCDVEGHEVSVLRGATAILAQGAAWLIEVSGDPDDPTSSASAVMSIMKDAGYTPCTLDGGVISPRKPGDQYINYFFFQPVQLDILRVAGLMNRREAV